MSLFQASHHRRVNLKSPNKVSIVTISDRLEQGILLQVPVALDWVKAELNVVDNLIQLEILGYVEPVQALSIKREGRDTVLGPSK